MVQTNWRSRKKHKVLNRDFIKIFEMGRICVLLIFCALFSGCANKRKSVKFAESISNVKSELHSIDAFRVIDTTIMERGKITITEVEFFPPMVDNVVGITDVATIKSIRQTVIETETEKRGESVEASYESARVDKVTTMNVEKTESVEVATAPDTKRWRYIFYIMVLVSGVFLYLRRIPILKWIKKVCR